MSSPQIELLIFEGCPHADPARTLLGDVVRRLCPAATIEEIDVTTPELAQKN